MWAGTPNRNIIPATERQDKKQQNRHPTIVCGIIIYNINGINYHVLYEYDENLESFFFRYKEQRDIVLAPSFLHLYKDQFQKTMKKYMVCGVCSSDEKYFQRGFLPLEEIFNSINIIY